jgi:RNA polymerase sigma factor (sigma-70 family)
LRTLCRFGVVGSFGDEQLLERFLARRDEAAEEAFAELVRRHGPMVLGACRRILRDAHEAEDAFQATFLVLARKAAAVVRREKVASWLYCVAVRTANEARVRAARRRAREERVSTPIHVEPPNDGFPDELRQILDEELARLPSRHRGPLVLCELEGLSRPEAARRLGIPEGTLSSRLARAKVRLRDRLASRGVSLPAAAISALLVREARAATVPLSLLESTVQAATFVAAGPSYVAAAGVLSASAASLSEGVIKAMFVAKLKGFALAVGTMTAVVSGAVVLAQPGDPQRGPAPPLMKVGMAPEQDQRAAVLESKLDRVLEVLERLAGAGGSRLAENPGALVTPRAENLAPAPRTTTAPGQWATRPSPRTLPSGGTPAGTNRAGMSPLGATVAAAWLMEDVADTRPLSERMQAVEQQIQGMLQRLERVEEQLKSLDARVGGGRGLRRSEEHKK